MQDANGDQAAQNATHSVARSPLRPGWYVVQVRTGQENRMCTAIEHACRAHDAQVGGNTQADTGATAATGAGRRVGLVECFNPRFRSQRKWKGEWVSIERPLLPGYVIADVRNPAELVAAASRIREFCRVLATEEAYEPLSEDERLWIDSQTQKGDRVILMSFGYREGDKLTVTEGPLKGREGMIVKVDRANSLAHLEFHVGPMTIHTQVGLGVVPK